jgi:hypothetical protein
MSGIADGLPMGYGPCIDAPQLVTQRGPDCPGDGSPTLAHAVNRKIDNNDSGRISRSPLFS